MTRRALTLRVDTELADRLDKQVADDPSRPSLNQLICTLLEQALDCQQQGKLDQILTEVADLRDDLAQARRLRKRRAGEAKRRKAGEVLDAVIVEEVAK